MALRGVLSFSKKIKIVVPITAEENTDTLKKQGKEVHIFLIF